jgi:hypothetical protein
MDNEKSKKPTFKWLLGEYRWSKYMLWIVAFFCLIEALNSTGFGTGGFGRLIRDGAFHSTLLFGIAANLSEFRYRFMPETRND